MEIEGAKDNQPGRKRRRSSLSLGLLLIAVLLIGLIGFLWMRKMQERQEFVSNVDAATGYQCRFTVDADWKIERAPPSRQGDIQVEVARFDPLPPGPIHQWINDRILHRAPRSLNHGIWLMTSPQQTAQLPLRGGYPDLRRWHPSSARNMIIDGCASTLATFTGPRRSPFKFTRLYVITPDHTVVYNVDFAYLKKGDQMDKEVQEIIRSFHVKKLGKR